MNLHIDYEDTDRHTEVARPPQPHDTTEEDEETLRTTTPIPVAGHADNSNTETGEMKVTSTTMSDVDEGVS